ncbi:MAG: ComF family protein [Clostridia bacterium]|nr:ComF family protein [Clostridia bacterium]
MDEFKRALREIFFPSAYTCGICKREIFNGEYICEDCKKNLPYNDGYICDHCGRKTFAPISYCDACKGKENHFDIARSAFVYQKPINHAVQNLKYNNYKYLAREFASEMAKVYLKTFYPCGAIVFVPTSKKKVKERGYNQSELIARAVGEKLSLPVFDDVIYKSRDTESQVGLTQKERLINLSGSFSIKNRSKIAGERVLVIDDVLTTGTTADLVSEKLKAAGAEAVFVLTVASVYYTGQE